MIELDAGLEEYIERHTEKEPDVLAQLSRATHQKMLRPRMLSGNMQGQLLKMLCRMNRVQRVLEIGTFTGYAAIAMAMGMEAGGVLHTIDINDELEDFTRAFIRRSGLEERIVFHLGVPAGSSPNWMNYSIWYLLTQINDNMLNIIVWWWIKYVPEGL